MAQNGIDSDRPEEDGPVGKPSQAEGNDGGHEVKSPNGFGKPSQAEGDADDANTPEQG